MDLDITAIKNKLGIVHQNDDDDENDEELMAELLELQGETSYQPKHNDASISSAKEPTRFKIPDKLSTSMPEADMEISDADMDDNDLMLEFNNLVEDGAIAKNKASSVQNINTPSISDTQRTTKKREHELHSDLTAIPTPPPIPPRSSSMQLNEHITNKPQKEEQNANTSLKSRAQSILMRRRKLYLDIAKAAKETNDRETAVKAFETVKLFSQALEVINEGAELTEEDLEQIPPTPPAYIHPKEQQKKEVPTVENGEITHKTPLKRVPKEPTNIHKNADGPYMSEELKLTLMRQMQLKKAAMDAKKEGDLLAAKRYLKLAHQMDQMIEAAKCGLPIDVQQIPQLSSTSKAISSSISKRSPVDKETLRKCQLLEKELLKQIELCREKASQFQSIGDSKNVLFYEGLQQNCKNDLQRVQMAMLGNSQLTGFKMVEILLPNVEVNPMIPDDELQLRISKIENLQLPQGWKPSDCSLFVSYKFPFPHGSQQTGKTSIVRGSTSPEFLDIFQLKISRKTKQLSRICKRIPLKLEIYHRAGFLRSDKLFGHADISLQDLEGNAIIQGHFHIYDGRKKNGGSIHVDIRISKPIGGNDNETPSTGIKRRWVKIEN